MSANSIAKQVLEKFCAKKDLISSRINCKGLHYVMEGYIQTVKIHTEGNKLKFSLYSDLPHSLIHITHFFLSCCGLGMEYTAFCSLLEYRLSVLHVPQAYRLTIVFVFYDKGNPPFNFASEWSCPSRCPSIV